VQGCTEEGERVWLIHVGKRQEKNWGIGMQSKECTGDPKNTNKLTGAD